MSQKKQFHIRYRFPPKADNARPKQLLFKAIYVLPEEVLDYFQKNQILFCWNTENDKAEAVRFNDEDTKEFKFIVHFPSRIWNYTDDKIFSFIIIQMAHCYLGNESGFWSFEKSKDLVPKQESKAQELTKQWIQNYIQKKFNLDGCRMFTNLNAKPVDDRFIDSYS